MHTWTSPRDELNSWRNLTKKLLLLEVPSLCTLCQYQNSQVCMIQWFHNFMLLSCLILSTILISLHKLFSYLVGTVLKLMYSSTRPVRVALLQKDLQLGFGGTANKAGTGWFPGIRTSLWIKFQKLKNMNSRTKALIQRQAYVTSRIWDIFEMIIPKHLAVLVLPQNKYRIPAPSVAVTSVRARSTLTSPWVWLPGLSMHRGKGASVKPWTLGKCSAKKPCESFFSLFSPPHPSVQRLLLSYGAALSMYGCSFISLALTLFCGLTPSGN